MQCRPPDKLRLLRSVEPIACKRVPYCRRMNAYLMCPPRAKSEFDRSKPAFVFISLSIVFFFYNDVFSLFVFLRTDGPSSRFMGMSTVPVFAPSQP